MTAAHTRPVSPSPQREADPQGRPCAETRCPGRRMADGARLGLCLLCSRLVDTRTGTLEPLAVKVRGLAQCPNYAGAV